MNKYNSLSDSFIATDLYNLPMPVLPPADLSIASTGFAPSYLYNRMGAATKVVGFNKRDQPYIRGLGLFSNLADGLVDSASAHFGNSSSWRVTYQLERFATYLSGAITNVAGSTAVSGVGTAFDTELSIGSVFVWCDNNGCVRSGTVAAIASATALTLLSASSSTGMLTANTTSKVAYPLIGSAGTTIEIPFLALNAIYAQAFFLGDVSGVHPPTGTVSVVAASAAVVGVGTLFTTEYSLGMPIVFGVGSNRRVYVVNSITDDTHLTLTANASVTVTGAPLIDYDDHLRIKCSIGAAFNAYTVSIDPAYGDGTRRLALHTAAEIEHSFPLSEAIS